MLDGQEKNVHGDHKQEEGAKQFEIVRSFFEPEGTWKKPLFHIPIGLVLHMNLLPVDQRIPCQCIPIQVFPIHVHAGDLVIFISGIVVNSSVCTAAGGVECDFIFAVSYFAATPLLVYRSQDMEELADALVLRISGSGVRLCKCHTDEAGCGGEISRKPQSAHAAAVGLQIQIL